MIMEEKNMDSKNIKEEATDADKSSKRYNKKC